MAKPTLTYLIIGGLIALTVGILAIFAVSESSQMTDEKSGLEMDQRGVDPQDSPSMRDDVMMDSDPKENEKMMKEDNQMHNEVTKEDNMMEHDSMGIADLSPKQYHETNKAIIETNIDNLILNYKTNGLDSLSNKDFFVTLEGAIEGVRFMYIVDHEQGVVGKPDNSLGIYTNVPQLENGQSLWKGETMIASDNSQTNEFYYFKSFDGLSFLSGYVTYDDYKPEFINSHCTTSGVGSVCIETPVQTTTQDTKHTNNFTPIEDLREQGFYVDPSCSKTMVTVLLQYSNMFTDLDEEYQLDLIGVPYTIPPAQFNQCESTTLQQRN